MLHKHFRSFSILQTLKALQAESEVHSQKTNEAFMKSYSEFIEKNHDDLYCYSHKLTPSQTQRVEHLADEILKLSPVSHRVFMYLMIENQKRNFNYRPLFKETTNKGEVYWTDHIWPSIHPANIEFQKETGEHGLIGYTGCL